MKRLPKLLALLLICVMPTLSACGPQAGDKKAETKTEAKKEEKKEEKKDEKKDEKKEDKKADDKKDDKKADEQKEAKAFEGKYIVNADYVKGKIGDKNTIIVDSRGAEAAAKGHVKGAIAMTWQDIARVSDVKPGQEGWGHVLSPEDLSKKLGELGLAMDKEIIIYSVANEGWGDDGRIAWALKAAGYENLKLVDGGFKALEKAGIEMDKEEVKLDPVEVAVKEVKRDNIIDTKELTDTIKDYKIVDSREKEEYEGATLYGEAKGGHLPGAINVPFKSLFNKDGLLKSNDEITKIFEEAGLKKDDKIVTYCTGGIRSAYMQMIMEMLGFNNVKNYEGSYYNWAAINDVE